MSSQRIEMRRSVILEIRHRLEGRLVTSQHWLSILKANLEDIKSQYLIHNNDILEIRDKLKLANNESRVLLAGMRIDEHKMNLGYIFQMERVLERTIAEKHLLAGRFTKVTQDIRDKGYEITGIENAINEVRALDDY